MYASLADVRRVLRIPDSSVDEERDAALRVSLAAVEDWLKQRLRLSEGGAQVEAYWDIPEDATLHLPADDVTVVKVKAFGGTSAYFDSTGYELSYDITGDGKLILRPSYFTEPFEGAIGTRRNRVYSRVEVFYLGTGAIPSGVTEAAAMLAAGYWKEGPRILAGLKSEKIGDYSYTAGGATDDTGQPMYASRAMWLLRDYLKKSKVRVI